MTWFLLWIGLAVVVGVAANNCRGRNGGGWFLLALLISPLLAGLLVLVMSDVRVERAILDSRKCPHCAEQIKREAVVCRYCGHQVTALPPVAENIKNWKAASQSERIQKLKEIDAANRQPQA